MKRRNTGENDGWILIYRKIKDHWLWKSDKRLKWWIDVLLTVNHCDTPVLIRGELLLCKRAQCIRSLGTWAKEWGVSKGAVRDFFKLLNSDSMIEIENYKHITTRITVLNYDNYQKPIHSQKTNREQQGESQDTKTNKNKELKEGLVKKTIIKTITNDAK